MFSEIVVVLLIFASGFAVGYAVRDWKSRGATKGRDIEGLKVAHRENPKGTNPQNQKGPLTLNERRKGPVPTRVPS